LSHFRSQRSSRLFSPGAKLLNLKLAHQSAAARPAPRMFGFSANEIQQVRELLRAVGGDFVKPVDHLIHCCCVSTTSVLKCFGEEWRSNPSGSFDSNTLGWSSPKIRARTADQLRRKRGEQSCGMRYHSKLAGRPPSGPAPPKRVVVRWSV